jgi:zinc D-Ala-D-Ala carboxypeptidase
MLKGMVRRMRQHREIHYTMLSPDDWRWKNFTPKEIACKGTGLILIDEDAMDKLQAFRNTVEIPFRPNSAYRSESHNKRVGGAPRSMHRQGRAFDIPITSRMTRELIHEKAKEVGFTGFGDYNTFVHIDTGRARYWDGRK